MFEQAAGSNTNTFAERGEGDIHWNRKGNIAPDPWEARNFAKLRQIGTKRRRIVDFEHNRGICQVERAHQARMELSDMPQNYATAHQSRRTTSINLHQGLFSSLTRVEISFAPGQREQQ